MNSQILIIYNFFNKKTNMPYLFVAYLFKFFKKLVPLELIQIVHQIKFAIMEFLEQINTKLPNY